MIKKLFSKIQNYILNKFLEYQFKSFSNKNNKLKNSESDLFKITNQITNLELNNQLEDIILQCIKFDHKEFNTNYFHSFNEILKNFPMKINNTSINGTYNKKQIFTISGINGVGKTTSMIKLFKNLSNLKYKVSISSLDNFNPYMHSYFDCLDEKNSNINIIFPKLFKKTNSQNIKKNINHILSIFEKNDSNILLLDFSGRMPDNKNLISELHNVSRYLISLCKTMDIKIQNIITLSSTTSTSVLSESINNFKFNVNNSILITNFHKNIYDFNIFKFISNSNYYNINIIFISENNNVDLPLTNFNDFVNKYESYHKSILKKIFYKKFNINDSNIN